MRPSENILLNPKYLPIAKIYQGYDQNIGNAFIQPKTIKRVYTRVSAGFVKYDRQID